MKWLQFILSHSVFIAFCAVALVFQTTQLLQSGVSEYVYGFIFFSTLCSYNFYWILSKITFADQARIPALLKDELTGFMLFMIAAAGTLICFYYSSLSAGPVITAVLLTVAYSVPLLPVQFLKFSRKAGVLKTVLLACTWAYVTAFMPLQKTYAELSKADLFVISRRFLFMLMLCILFDNRDKAVDKIRGLHSLATDLKPLVLKWLIYLIFAILFTSNFFYEDFGISLVQSIALQVSTLALLIVYFFSLKKQGYYFYYFVVDGMMLFSALATFIAGI